MVTNYNKVFCAICGKPADDWRETPNGVRVWVCDDNKCQREIDQELRDNYRY